MSLSARQRRKIWAAVLSVSLVGIMGPILPAQAAVGLAPGAPLSRGQLAEALMQTYNLTASSVGPIFRDVLPTSPYSTAIETVTGDLLMKGVSEFSFAPNLPATRLDLASALVNQLGLKDTVKLIDTSPPVGDANQIPTSDWGIVDAALQLHLLTPNAQGDFAPNGPVTSDTYASATEAEQATSAAQVSAVANQAANAVWIGFPYWENASQSVNVGTTIQQIAYQVEGGADSELVLPGLATLTTTAGTLGAGGSWTAPDQPGLATITAQADGTNITQSLPMDVYEPTALQFDQSNPSKLVKGQQVTVTGDVMSPNPIDLSTRTIDTADNARVLTLTVVSPSGQASQYTSADNTGQSTFSFTPQMTGTYQLTLSSQGLPSVSDIWQVTSAPLALASVSVGEANITYGQTVPVAVYLAPTAGVTLPAYMPIVVTENGAGNLTNVAASIYTPAAEMPGGTIIAQLTGGPTLGPAPVTVSTPGDAFASALASVNVTASGSITAAVPSNAQPAGASVEVSATLQLANGKPAPAGIAVYFTPTAPDGEEGLLATRSEYNSAVAYTDSEGVATTSLADQYMSGTYSLSVSANGFTDANTSYQVIPGPAVKLDAVIAPSPFIMDGQSANVNVSAVDQYGNPVPGFSMPVQVAFRGLDGQFKQTATAVDGQGTVGSVTAGAVRGEDQVSVSSTAFPGQVMNLPVMVITKPDQIIEGKGTWATYNVYGALGAQGMINAMKADGITHLYLETAASGAGFYGQLPLDRIVDLAHQNGIAVITWTYAALWNVPSDEADAQASLTYKTRLGSMTDGYTGDFEENLSPSAMQQYSAFIRGVIGPDQPYVATIYPPQDGAGTPLSTLTPYVNAFAPMDYWHGMEQDYTFGQVYDYVTTSMKDIQAAAPSVPIEVIAETYDMWSGTGTGLYNPSGVEEEAAMLAASNGGAKAISFYDLRTMSAQQAEVISRLPYPISLPLAPGELGPVSVMGGGSPQGPAVPPSPPGGPVVAPSQPGVPPVPGAPQSPVHHPGPPSFGQPGPLQPPGQHAPGLAPASGK